MSKFHVESHVFRVKNPKADRWTKAERWTKDYWDISAFQIYDIAAYFNDDGKLFAILCADAEACYRTSANDGGNSFKRGMLAHTHEWMQKIPKYQQARVISRQDLKRELQRMIAKRALSYMDAVMQGKDTYDD